MHEPEAAAAQQRPSFQIGYVEGVSPGKWLRHWAQRYPRSPLEATMVPSVSPSDLMVDRVFDMAFVRQPFDSTGLHLIPLYEEQPVVVVPRDHPAADSKDLSLDDLRGQGLIGDPAIFGWVGLDLDPVPGLPQLTLAHAVETVAAGTGVTLLPLSLARLHHRKDVVARPIRDLSPVRVGLAWDKLHDDPNLERFIGIVRGRTEHGSRSEPATSNTKPKAKPTATKQPQRRSEAGAVGQQSKKGRPRTGSARRRSK